MTSPAEYLFLIGPCGEDLLGLIEGMDELTPSEFKERRRLLLRDLDFAREVYRRDHGRSAKDGALNATEMALT